MRASFAREKWTEKDTEPYIDTYMHTLRIRCTPTCITVLYTHQIRGHVLVDERTTDQSSIDAIECRGAFGLYAVVFLTLFFLIKIR